MGLYLIITSIFYTFIGSGDVITLKINSEIVDKGYFYLESYDSGKIIKERFVFELNPGVQTISKSIPHKVDSINEFRVYFSVLNKKNDISIYEMSYNGVSCQLIFTPDKIEKQFIFNQYIENIYNKDSCLVFSSFPIDNKNDSYIRWVKSRSPILKFHEYNISLQIQSNYSFVVLCFFDDDKKRGLYFANSFNKLDFDYYKKNSQKPLKFKLFSENPISKLRFDFAPKNMDSLKILIKRMKIEIGDSTVIINRLKLPYFFGVGPCGKFDSTGNIFFKKNKIIGCDHYLLFSKKTLFDDKSCTINKTQIYGKSDYPLFIRMIGASSKDYINGIPVYDYSNSQTNFVPAKNFHSQFDLVTIGKLSDIRIEFLSGQNNLCIDSIKLYDGSNYRISGTEIKKYFPRFNNLVFQNNNNYCLEISNGEYIPAIESKQLIQVLFRGKYQFAIAFMFLLISTLSFKLNKFFFRS